MIHPLKYYSPQDLEDLAKEGFFPIKEKISIIKLIESGKLIAVDISISDGRKYWKIKGSDILAFLDNRGSFKLNKDDGKKTNSRPRGKAKETKTAPDTQEKV